MASKQARAMIVKRAVGLGLDWDSAMRDMQGQDWTQRMAALTDPTVRYPDYYVKPFHAYTQGNLCLEAAMEVTMAAKSVHASVMDPTGKIMDPQGDEQLRSQYGARMEEALLAAGVPLAGLRSAVDMGCSTGLSSVALLQRLPAGARVSGVDLSPHFLAVAQYQQQQRESVSGQAEPLTFHHAAAEATGLAAGSYDLVSACLVLHELPQSASHGLLREAFRLLRPGGVLSIMEMNPASPAFQRIFANPFAYTAFKSTEPWLQEYVTLDLHAAIAEAGFMCTSQRDNTPRHRTVVAIKP